jgi:RhoGAP domain
MVINLDILYKGMLWRLTLLLAKLPEEHFYLLKRVLGVLRGVVENTSKNGVTVDALANVIG